MSCHLEPLRDSSDNVFLERKSIVTRLVRAIAYRLPLDTGPRTRPRPGDDRSPRTAPAVDPARLDPAGSLSVRHLVSALSQTSLARCSALSSVAYRADGPEMKVIAGRILRMPPTRLRRCCIGYSARSDARARLPDSDATALASPETSVASRFPRSPPLKACQLMIPPPSLYHGRHIENCCK